MTEAHSTRKPASLNEVQHGGSHYKGLAIEPAEYCQRNRLDFCESEAIKYLTRHGMKNGAEDVQKAMHFCAMILDMNYGITATTEYVQREPEGPQPGIPADMMPESTEVLRHDAEPAPTPGMPPTTEQPVYEPVEGDQLGGDQNDGTDPVVTDGQSRHYEGYTAHEDLKPGTLRVKITGKGFPIRDDGAGNLMCQPEHKQPMRVGSVDYQTGWLQLDLPTFFEIPPKGHHITCDYERKL